MREITEREMRTAQELETIQDTIWSAHGLTSRARGKEWLQVEAEIIAAILDTLDALEDITPGAIAQLEEENYHGAAHAAECVRYLCRYADPFRPYQPQEELDRVTVEGIPWH